MTRRVEALLAQYETKILKAKLLEFPALIRAAKDAVYKARAMLREAEIEAAALEAAITVDVAAETGDNGKPRFSNAEARAAEVARRKAQDSKCRDLQSNIRQFEWGLHEAQSNLEKLQDEFKAYRYIVRLTTAEIALLAEDDEVTETPKGPRDDSEEPF